MNVEELWMWWAVSGFVCAALGAILGANNGMGGAGFVLGLAFGLLRRGPLDRPRF